MQKYSDSNPKIEILLGWVKSGEIAIPEIQRPFVWPSVKVRNFLDSLYQGYPVGYIISWRNPNVKLKDGTSSSGKKILIDGQQRITALNAALYGQEVLTKEYKKVRIRIAFDPLEEKFEVWNPAISNNSRWIDDISKIFADDAYLAELTDEYVEKNQCVDRKRQINTVLENVKKIVTNTVGVIELAENLDIETVTEIFIRVNSEGVVLSQADFAMSKIAVNEDCGGNVLRKAIDYFCHSLVNPEYISVIEKNDPDFTSSEFWSKMRWLKGITSDTLYEPKYTDVLRVAFTMEFGRGKLADLVALLSGRNFDTKGYEQKIIEESFAKLKKGIDAFIHKTHFDSIIMSLSSAGFCKKSLITSNNAVNFAYIVYLLGRSEGLSNPDAQRLVRRWYAMSILTGRYSGSPESMFSADIHGIKQGLLDYCDSMIKNELHEQFWAVLLPQHLSISSTKSPYFIAFQAAQVNLSDKGFLSANTTVQDILTYAGDGHHVFPQNYLKSKGHTRGSYNQIANLVFTEGAINKAIGDKAPEKYFTEIIDQVNGGQCKYGDITNTQKLQENFKQHCIPEEVLDGKLLSCDEYDDFLEKRRLLMALRIKEWYNNL